MRRYGTYEVPAIAGDVEEDGHPAVRLVARLGDERHAGRRHPPVRGVEVLDLQEKADAPADLVTDGRGLALAVRTGQQDARFGARRPDDDPALRPADLRRQRGRVLHQVEPQRLGEEPDGLVVVVDHDRDLVYQHASERMSGRTSSTMPAT